MIYTYLFCLLVVNYTQNNYITPEDITQTSRITTRCGCSYTAKLPDVPSFVYDAAKDFMSQYASYNISSKLNNVTIHYKDRYGSESFYYEYFKIPTIVYELSFDQGPSISIEANSRTVLYFYWRVLINQRSFQKGALSNNKIISNKEIFARAITLLEQYGLPTIFDNYIITEIFVNKYGIKKDEYFVGSKQLEIEMCFPERHYDKNVDCDYIIMYFNRYTGVLTEFQYVPGSEKIQKWCELTESKKQQKVESEKDEK